MKKMHPKKVDFALLTYLYPAANKEGKGKILDGIGDWIWISPQTSPPST